MKTQIIQLEPHDDQLSIRDKMNWSKTPRILLVFPRRKRFDLDTLDLKLLQRHAISLGADLGLVTKSSKVIRAARALNIPVFESNLSAQREAWPPQKNTKQNKRKRPKNLREKREEIKTKEAAWRKHPLARLVFFSLATLALLSLAFAFIPQATIQLEPERQKQKITIPVRANPNTEEVFLSGSIPAYKRQVTLTASRSLPASGRKAIPAQVARGTVRFRNLTDEALLIPAGTVIRSIADPEIRFETLNDAEIAAGVNAEMEIPVRSLVFGERGNLDPDLLQAIEGDLGLWLAATNPEPTSGGGDNFVSAPARRDYEDLHDTLVAQFYQEAEEEIKKNLKSGDLIFPDSISEPEILEEIYDPPLGETGDRLTLTMSVAITLRYATEADLEKLAESALSASLPPNFSPVPNSLRITPASDFESSTLGITTWQMRVEQELLPNISAFQVAALTQGRDIEIAIQNLENTLDLASKPKISVSPYWWKWMPIAPFRIELVLK